jgi:hypothetical protein
MVPSTPQKESRKQKVWIRIMAMPVGLGADEWYDIGPSVSVNRRYVEFGPLDTHSALPASQPASKYPKAQTHRHPQMQIMALHHFEGT